MTPASDERPAGERRRYAVDLQSGRSGRATLANGALVEASIVVRLLKLRLLTLDAAILLVPPPADAARSRAAEPRLPRSAVAARAAGNHRQLADALSDLDRTAELLARARAGT